jgi:DHA2 family multidrug resistance protein
VGWLLLAVSMYISARQIDLLIGFGNASWLRVLQSVSLPFLFVPLTLAGYVGLPSTKTNSAAGLMNFMRNMGQSIGTSALTTVLARRDQFHQSILADYTASPRFQTAIQGLARQLHTAGLSTATAQHQAFGRLYNMVQAQAAALSYVDAYWLLAVAGAIMFLGSFLLRPNDPRKGGSVAIH